MASRPLSPHLSVWKWRPAMAVSIFHRVSGHALAFAGLALFAWWLMAAATSKEAYATFLAVVGSPVGWIVLGGIAWMAFQHLLSGLRHLAMDAGWGYELGRAHGSAVAVFAGAAALLVAFVAAFLLGPGGF
jgi:succinate dehydrogenase / fumarate reductase cytochrome b subunit